jgi:hypothetical protein
VTDLRSGRSSEDEPTCTVNFPDGVTQASFLAFQTENGWPADLYLTVNVTF